MGDMWDALDRVQRKSMSPGQMSSPKRSTLSARALAEMARQHFKRADFTNSGKIDDDECVEILDTIAGQGGFSVPPPGEVRSVLALCWTTKHFLKLDEFTALHAALIHLRYNAVWPFSCPSES